jgi:hypothetical protein
MKLSRTLRSTVAAVGTFICVAASAHAQTYSIDWFTIDGGGGTSTGGNYSLSGTIGQPDAGLMTGGSYSLAGGFWSIQAIDIPGFPRLSITPAGNEVIISWTPGTPDSCFRGMAASTPPAGPTRPAGARIPSPFPPLPPRASIACANRERAG